MTQKDPYIPILVGLGPKLWSVTLKLCQRAKLSVPFLRFVSDRGCHVLVGETQTAEVRGGLETGTRGRV